MWPFCCSPQFPARGSTQVLLCLFPGVLWLWHFLYSVGPHPMSSLHIYTFIVSREIMACAASQAGGADSSRAPGLISGFQRPGNVHCGALLLVSKWKCISSFVFYIDLFLALVFWVFGTLSYHWGKSEWLHHQTSVVNLVYWTNHPLITTSCVIKWKHI